MPEAFAVMKETATLRKVQKSLLQLPNDKDLSKEGPHQNNGGNDLQNQWTAAGGQIIWNTIHYDVQLIGERFA